MLHFFAPGKLSFRPFPFPLNPGTPILERRVNEYHRIADEVKVRLIKQRTVEHHHPDARVRFIQRDLVYAAHRDARMKQGLKPVPLRRVGEDDRPDAPTTHVAVGRENLAAPPAAQSLLDLRMVDLLVTQGVGINDTRPKFAQDLRNTALARTDPARETDKRLGSFRSLDFVDRGARLRNAITGAAAESLRRKLGKKPKYPLTGSLGFTERTPARIVADVRPETGK